MCEPKKEKMAKPANDGEAGKVARLSLPLTPDGTVDWDHVRPSTASRFLDIIRTDPQVKEAYMIGAGESPAESSLFEGITSENVASALDTFQSANAFIFRMMAARFIKHPLGLKTQDGRALPFVLDQRVLDSAFKLTEKQHAELDPRATRLAQKYSGAMPDWLKKNLDLYMFGAMLLSYTAMNAKNAMTLQMKVDLVRVQTAVTQHAAAQPKNPQPDSDAARPSPTNGHATTAEIIDPLMDVVRQHDAENPPEAPSV